MSLFENNFSYNELLYFYALVIYFGWNNFERIIQKCISNILMSMMQGYSLDIPIAVETVSTAFWIVTECLSSSKEKEREGIENQPCVYIVYIVYILQRHSLHKPGAVI
jgi:hypothetical protein